MLLLSRSAGQRIVINEQITLTVVEIGSGRVRLGFEAPREINIRREELPPLGYERIKEDERKDA